MVPDSGIFRFFLLLVFSKLSYPSADDAVEPGGGGLPAREASINRRCNESTGFVAVPLAVGPGGYR